MSHKLLANLIADIDTRNFTSYISLTSFPIRREIQQMTDAINILYCLLYLKHLNITSYLINMEIFESLR